MRTLVAVEIRRLVSRRLAVILAGAAFLGILIAGVTTFAKSHTTDAAVLEGARRAAVEQCLQGQLGPSPEELGPAGVEKFQEICATTDFVGDPRFHLAQLTEIFKGVSAAVTILALLIAASFIGAEWHHRTLTTTLTWEPRRGRVLVAKGIAAAVVAFLGALAFFSILGLALTPAGVFRGTTTGIDAAWFGSVAGTALRASSLASLAALLGLSIATLGRNTAAALGFGFAYLAVLERMLGALRPRWQPWLFGDLAAIFVGAQRHEEVFAGRSVAEAGVILSVYVLAVFAGAAAIFRRRDVA